ncbi:MAG: pilus assembly FimT family protein [bacterium]
MMKQIFIKYKNNGFTLIEITIVIFIILLITSAAVPWMKTFAESSRLKTTARSIRSLMEFARNSAITERTEYVVMFDSNNGEYWLSLAELLNESSSGTVTDQSRISLSESLSNLSNQNTSSDQNTDNRNTQSDQDQTLTGRTGGILGIPKQLPKGVEIVQIRSERSSNIRDNMEYVTFYPNSTAEDFEIYLQSNSGKTFLISVTKVTGRTSIRELKLEEIEELGLDKQKT